MSFDIGSVGRTPAPASTQKTRSAAAQPAQAAQIGDTVTVDTIPASPPQEVQDAMGVANQAYHNLQASGSELRFKVDESSGKVSVEVHDVHGNLLFTVPASTALDVASGQPLPSNPQS
jgi:putative hemolysin